MVNCYAPAITDRKETPGRLTSSSNMTHVHVSAKQEGETRHMNQICKWGEYRKCMVQRQYSIYKGTDRNDLVNEEVGKRFREIDDENVGRTKERQLVRALEACT